MSGPQRRSPIAWILDTDDKSVVRFLRRVGLYEPLDRLARALARTLDRVSRR